MYALDDIPHLTHGSKHMGKPKNDDEVLEATSTSDAVESIAFDLDSRAAAAPVEENPFTFRLAGEVLTLADPERVDWQQWQLAIDSGSPYQVLGALLNEEDGDLFFDASVPLGDMRDLLEAWKEHYGVEDLNIAGSRSNPAANRAERRARKGKGRSQR